MKGFGTSAGHFAQDVVQRLLEDPAEEWGAAGLVGAQIDPAQQRVIAKRLLKVVRNTQYVFCAHRAVGAR
jgi:hypothetical protein